MNLKTPKGRTVTALGCGVDSVDLWYQDIAVGGFDNRGPRATKESSEISAALIRADEMIDLLEQYAQVSEAATQPGEIARNTIVLSAMQAILPIALKCRRCLSPEFPVQSDEQILNLIADTAYRMADAMIARGKPEEPLVDGEIDVQADGIASSIQWEGLL